MQQDAGAVVAEEDEDEDDDGADVEALGPALDDGVVARVVEGVLGRGAQVTPGDHQRGGHGPQAFVCCF